MDLSTLKIQRWIQIRNNRSREGFLSIVGKQEAVNGIPNALQENNRVEWAGKQ